MRFKKGDRVEVMNKEDAPVSWRVAEILLTGDGHAYRVKYDAFCGTAGERMVERISRKLVRPCPPLVEGIGSCVVGDIVEVFYKCSWKIAAIVEVLECKIRRHAAVVATEYLVRLLGTSQELVTDMLNIRRRQAWHNGKWILMGENPQGGEDILAGKPSTSNCYQKMNFHISLVNGRPRKPAKQDYLKIQDGAKFLDSPVISSRSLKRMSPYGSSIVETHGGHIRKLRAIEKDDRKEKVVAATPVLEKVDAATYPRRLLREKNMHFPFNNISNGYKQTERAKLRDDFWCSEVRSSDISRSDSDACSVGSCSATSHSPNSIPLISLREVDTLSSDAESCSGSGLERKCSSLLPKEKIEVSVRRLELHAYRSTLEALYASGPLSWDQEAMLTNLRIMLHISNDEHLLELKLLIPAKHAVNVGYL